MTGGVARPYSAAEAAARHEYALKGTQQAPRVPVIPYPASVVPLTGRFTIVHTTRIAIADTTNPELRRLATFAAQAARVANTPVVAGAGTIRLVLGSASDTAQGAYRLTVNSTGMTIAAAAPQGLFYGIQTLRQLVPPEGERAVAAVEIADRPRFGWRGMHLDVVRHHFPVAFVKRYIDLLARYKLNTFHWHLTDDQGWRIEIKKDPRLTTVGGFRRETVVAKNFDPFVGDGVPHGGFYTQDEIRDVVAYARERYVTVVPEIEMPGHSLAALAAYPELACTPGPFEVGMRWGVYDDVFCPTDRTFAFLEDVLTEVIALFPGTYVHVGGDEVTKVAWRQSDSAQAVMRREGLKDEHELQSWFIKRIERFLISKNRRLIGWDEILEGGLAPEATVMSWRGTRGGIEAAQQGHDVIMTPDRPLYFDHYQGDRAVEPMAIGGFNPLEAVYAYEPVPAVLTPAQTGHILGAQANLWTEYITSTVHVEYMALPRMLALAEVVWSPKAARDWTSFRARLDPELAALERLGVNYRRP